MGRKPKNTDKPQVQSVQLDYPTYFAFRDFCHQAGYNLSTGLAKACRRYMIEGYLIDLEEFKKTAQDSAQQHDLYRDLARDQIKDLTGGK